MQCNKYENTCVDECMNDTSCMIQAGVEANGGITQNMDAILGAIMIGGAALTPAYMDTIDQPVRVGLGALCIYALHFGVLV